MHRVQQCLGTMPPFLLKVIDDPGFEDSWMLWALIQVAMEADEAEAKLDALHANW